MGCDRASGELHATFSDSPPSGSAPVSWHGEYRRRKQPAQASPSRIIGQTHTCPRCSIHRNEAYTTNYNSDFPAQQNRKVTLLATRFVHPHSWSQPTKTPTFPRQQADKSLHNHHVLSILIVGPNQLKHRLSRINKPKSHPSSNT